MTKTPRLNTARRREFALRCMVAEKLKRARTKPAKGFLPLSIQHAAAEVKMGSRHFRMVEEGERLPRYRLALRVLPWVKRRLGLEPTEKGE